jgi:hypothetical protein
VSLWLLAVQAAAEFERVTVVVAIQVDPLTVTVQTEFAVRLFAVVLLYRTGVLCGSFARVLRGAVIADYDVVERIFELVHRSVS